MKIIIFFNNLFELSAPGRKVFSLGRRKRWFQPLFF
jgi:hypothetical protein